MNNHQATSNPQTIAAEVEWVKSLPRKIGKAELIKHLTGRRLTARQRLNAACYRCSSGYDSGIGCTVPCCPLAPLNPYNLKQNKADLSVYGDVTDSGDCNGLSDNETDQIDR